MRGVVAAVVAGLAVACGGAEPLEQPPVDVDADGGAATAPADAGGGEADAGATPLDAGRGEADAGSTPLDAGSGATDAGSSPPDAGVLSALPVAAGSDGCNAAPVLGPGSWQVDTTGAQGDVSQWEGACGVASTAAGPDRFFTVEVPAGSGLRASILSGSFSGARLALFGDCAAPTTTCERLGSEAVAWANTGGTSRHLLLAVDGFLGAQQGLVGVQVQVWPLAQQPAGATCAAPLALVAPGSATGSTTGRDNLVDGYEGNAGACLRFGSFPGMGAGGDVTYAVDVPAGKTLSVTATALGGWDVVVAVLEACGDASATCAAWSDPGTAQVTNATGAPRTYYVVVDGFHPHSHGDFSLAASLN